MLYYNGALELSPAQDKQMVKNILTKNGLSSMSVRGLESAIEFCDYRGSAAISEQLEKVCRELRALGATCSGVLYFYGDEDGYIFVNEDGSVDVTDEEPGVIRRAYTEDLVAELNRRGYKVIKKVEEKPKEYNAIVLFSVEELCEEVMREMPCKSVKVTLGVNLKTGKTYEAEIRQGPLLYDPYFEVFFPDIPGFAYQHRALTEGVLAADFRSFQKRIQDEENGRIMYNQTLPGNWYDQETETLYIADQNIPSLVENGTVINGEPFNGFLCCHLSKDELSRLLENGEDPVEYMLGITPSVNSNKPDRMEFMPFEEALMLDTTDMIQIGNPVNNRVGGLESDCTQASNHAPKKDTIFRLERELFIAIVCDCVAGKTDKRLSSPAAIAERMYDKYRRAADEYGTWTMSQEGAYAICNLLEGIYDDPCRCAELLAMSNEAFLDLVSETAEKSALIALGIEE